MSCQNNHCKLFVFVTEEWATFNCNCRFDVVFFHPSVPSVIGMECMCRENFTPFDETLLTTRMHSSRMHTARSLTVSHRILCMPPGKNHTPPEKPCMPPGKNHTCPLAKTTHAPPSKNHACPLAKTMHAPLAKTMHPPAKTTHAPRSNHACPTEQPRMPPLGATMHAPPVNRITDACENITFADYVCGR